jgi:hypothetical protein
MHCGDARINPLLYNLAAQPVTLVAGSSPLLQLDTVHIPLVSLRHQDTLYHKEEVEVEVEVEVAVVVVVASCHTYLEFAPQGQPLYDKGVLLVRLFYTRY